MPFHPTRRLSLLLIALVVAAAAVGVAAATSSSGGEPPAPSVAAAKASKLLNGIPEHKGVLGDPKAPITITEYLDLQCPACAAAARDTLPALIRDHVRTGQVRLQARPLQFIGPDSVRAAQFAAAAAAQDKLWPFLEAFYASQGHENSGYVTDEHLRAVAEAAGVDAAAAFAYMDSVPAQDALNRANADAQTVGVEGTPTFAIARGDGLGRPIQGSDAATLSAAIQKELNR